LSNLQYKKYELLKEKNLRKIVDFGKHFARFPKQFRPHWLSSYIFASACFSVDLHNFVVAASLQERHFRRKDRAFLHNGRCIRLQA
jgi:hypothetical protein